jgi:hypothetical protein
MKTPPPMSQESEERLLRVLEKVALEEGEPNQLLARAATEERVPPGHIHLLTNAYNTGRTTLQRQSHDDVWLKAAHFPLADPQQVLDIMYPDTVKAASPVISEEYNLAPAWVLRQRERKKGMAKAPPFRPEHPRHEPAESGLEETRLKKKEGTYQKARREREEAQGVSQAHADRAALCGDRLLDYFQSSPHDPYPRVRKNAEWLFGKEQVTDLFDYLETTRPELLKQADDPLAPTRGEPYDLVREALEARRSHEEQAAALAAFSRAEHRARHEWLWGDKEAATELSAQDLLSGTTAQLKTAAGPGPAGMMGTLGLGAMLLGPLSSITANNDAMVKARAEAMAEKALKAPGRDPRFDAEITAIKRETILHDLLGNDEVIGAHDPQKVLESYHELSGLAPRASLQPGVMRDFLRRRLEGGPHSYFDLEGLTRIENNLAKLEHGGDRDEDEK